MLQQEQPEDFVIATRKITYVSNFVGMAFAECGLELTFEGVNENEIAKVAWLPKYDFAVKIKEMMKLYLVLVKNHLKLKLKDHV